MPRQTTGRERPPRGSRQHARSGQTVQERDAPYTDDPTLLAMERAAAAAIPDQLPLFAPGAGGHFAPLLGGLPTLEPTSSLDLARTWYRRELEQSKRPFNTIESYCYDLAKLEERTGPKQVAAITGADIAGFLALAGNKSTRKRRLTSLRRFFQYLIEDAQVLKVDPTLGFHPNAIQLRTPLPLFADEQEALLAAAAEDEPWSLCAVWLMLRLGLSRAELLALRREQIDLSAPGRPVVHVLYDDVTKRHKERRLAGDPPFADIYAEFLELREPVDVLFPVGYQAVNGMVDRVRKTAKIAKDVSPQTLRHTFAVDRARAGADAVALLALLGLIDDPRNRESVRRYLKLAEPPL